MGSRDRKSTIRSLVMRSVLWGALAVGIVVVAAEYGVDRVTGFATVGALLIATSPFAPQLRKWWDPPKVETSSADQRSEAAKLLRELVTEKWQPSAEFLQIGRIDDSMGIVWEDAEHATTGPISSLISDYCSAPRPLIVLGDLGSGKTALSVLLLRDLISKNQAQGDRIPVLVRLSSWDPDTSFNEWLVSSVYEQYDIYRQLRDTSRFGLDVVSHLLEDECLLPILDGLDELPPAARTNVIDQVRKATIFTSPFILTSRVAEYDLAIDKKPPSGKRTVRLLPISPEAVADYLCNLFSGDVERWQPIVDEIAGDPDGAVVATMSNPLMLYLACTRFFESNTKPKSLLDRDVYRTGKDIEHYLLDSFVPTVFRLRAAPPGQDAGSQPWRLESSRRGCFASGAPC